MYEVDTETLIVRLIQYQEIKFPLHIKIIYIYM